jgi:hypothetical protein
VWEVGVFVGLKGRLPSDFYDTHWPLRPTGFQVSLLLIRGRCEPDTQGISHYTSVRFIVLRKFAWIFKLRYGCGTHCKGTLIYTRSSGPKTLLSVRQQRQRTPVDKNVSWSQWCVWGAMHPVGPGFSPFEGGSGCWIFAVPNFVPTKFSLCFHKICKFSMGSPTCSQQLSLYAISCALSITLVTYTKEPKGWD